jgi:hypothetical protein
LKSSPLFLGVASILRYAFPEVEIKLFRFAILGYKISLIPRVIPIEHKPRVKKPLSHSRKKGKDAGDISTLSGVTANTPA